MKNKILIIVLILLSSISQDIYSKNPQTLLDSATSSYKNKDYAKAVDYYLQCQRIAGNSAELYANIGNSYAKLGDYGHAFLCYERSLRLKPGDKEVRNNRAFILSKIIDSNKANASGKKISVEPDEMGFFAKIGTFLLYRYSSNAWASCGVGMFLIFCGCILLYYFRTEELLRKIGFFAGIISLTLCIIFNILAFRSAKIYDKRDEGVIIEFKSTLKSEPSEASKSVGIPLVRGTKMDILEIEETEKGEPSWYKVRLNSDIAGWIKASEFEII